MKPNNNALGLSDAMIHTLRQSATAYLVLMRMAVVSLMQGDQAQSLMLGHVALAIRNGSRHCVRLYREGKFNGPGVFNEVNKIRQRNNPFNRGGMTGFGIN